MKFTVAIDGPAAAGKGTISKKLANYFGFAHLDTGLLYRAVARKALSFGVQGFERRMATEIALKLTDADIARDDLRTTEVAQAASRIAVIAPVRDALLKFQREFACRAGGAVLDGRDIGTVICPLADVKLFVTASADVRAQRRLEELLSNGETATFDSVKSAVIARDKRDAERDVAPLASARDAILIDTSMLSIDEAVALAVSAVSAKMDT